MAPEELVVLFKDVTSLGAFIFEDGEVEAFGEGIRLNPIVKTPWFIGEVVWGGIKVVSPVETPMPVVDDEAEAAGEGTKATPVVDIIMLVVVDTDLSPAQADKMVNNMIVENTSG